MLKTFNKIFSSRNEKYLNELKKQIPKINEIYKTLNILTDEEIFQKSTELKEIYNKKFEEFYSKNEKNVAKLKDEIAIIQRRNHILDLLLPEAFALLKEAVRREFHIELYDVQLLGGMVLHYGNIAEMKTGEGKTYTAILAAYLNALSGKNVHIVTVNDYLAQRDAEKVKPVFSRLNITVNTNIVDDNASYDEQQRQRKEAYSCDIIYGTSSNFGFDFLRDNGVYNIEDKVMNGRYFAIVDEVDSVLIDEARNPLIISSQEKLEGNKLNFYLFAREVIKDFEVGDIIEDDINQFQKEKKEIGDLKVDLRSKNIIFTEQGLNKISEKLKKLNVIKEEKEIYFPENLELFNLIQTAANVEFAYFLNKDYIIKDGKIIIIDQMTGRMQEGRSWSNGVHQAIEIKEGVELTPQNKTIATTTYQHYFNKYDKLAGMTGTADTEANEFLTVYNLETFIIPTNKKVQRKDYIDRVFLTAEQRDKIFLEIVKEEHKKGRPILIGTNSVRDNEYYSNLLNKENIKHEKLNAKNHMNEAEIIAKAGEKNSVTLATNMAGRGTDIILGGNFDKDKQELINNIYHSNQYINNEIEKIENLEKKQHQEIIDLGGLLVISLGRNESRRVDNQLRGRAGRQGDVGASQFLISLDDDIWNSLGEAKAKMKAIASVFDKTGTMELTSKFYNNHIENFQKKIEEHFFEGRKYVMQYAEISDRQTDVIYKFRDDILLAKEPKNYIEMAEELIKDLTVEKIENLIPNGSIFEEWNIEEIENFLQINEIDFSVKKWIEENEQNINNEKLKQILEQKIIDIFDKIKFMMEEKELGDLIKYIYIQNLDQNWSNHLTNIEYIRKAVGLKKYSGKDPKEIFKKEAFELFNELIENIKFDIYQSILNIQKYIGLNLDKKVLE